MYFWMALTLSWVVIRMEECKVMKSWDEKCKNERICQSMWTDKKNV